MQARIILEVCDLKLILNLIIDDLKLILSHIMVLKKGLTKTYIKIIYVYQNVY